MALTMNWGGLSDHIWQAKQRQKRKAESKKKRKPKPKKVKQPKEITKEVYHEMLKDVRWKKKKLSILKRFNYKCALCGSIDNLQVHHTEYRKGHAPWEYPNRTLVCLCDECHQKVSKDINHPLHERYI